ncbi:MULTISPECIES: hypothetical protein [unclassified Frigoribacterium]|uniref:hypothetical protein n=1 Tax=unclassified Frigoribacterium TaxID=2627005 RepID=UPI001565A9FC|nr:MULTISPECIES: hypothetical protein [unclassified Frigoribacterium]NQW87519.1 hypothetical protein [Frigoribacterium sp. VKM Ac-2860]NQX09672.1 hypothetical protein [Frigoribacterium sp. VKM Ac-2859]
MADVFDMSGIYLVTTMSGSRYRLNLKAMTAARFPDSDECNPLRRDADERPLLGLTEPVVGHPMILVLDLRGDGIETIRETNIVTLLERLE